MVSSKLHIILDRHGKAWCIGYKADGVWRVNNITSCTGWFIWESLVYSADELFDEALVVKVNNLKEKLNVSN